MAKKDPSAKKRAPKEKKLSAFWLAMIIYSLALAALIGVLLLVLSAFLRSYEENLPEKCAEEFVASLDGEKLAVLIEECLGDISEYESGELILERAPYISGRFGQAKLAKEYTSARPVYRIICGEHDVGKLILKRSEKDAAFGLAAWEVESALLYKEAVPGGNERLDISVMLPAEAELYVNGIPALPQHGRDSEYAGECVLAEYEGACRSYSLSGLATEPQLEAVYEGERSALTLKNGKCDWFSEEGRTFILTVPSGADVTIGGRRLPEGLAKKGEPTRAISIFEKELGEKLPPSDTYIVSGSPENARISVYLDGICLDGGEMTIEEKGEMIGLTYLYADAGLYKVKAVIPQEATLLINGIEAEASPDLAPFESLSGVSYLASGESAAVGALYEIGELLCEPEVRATLGGKELPLSFSRITDRAHTYEFYGEAVTPSEAMSSLTVGFSEAYFHYVANGAVGIEENYAALIGMMKAQSPGFKQIRNSKSSFEFVNQGVYRIDELSPRDYILIGDNMFSCRVDFSVHLRFYRNEKQYTGVLSLVCVREGDGYLVCDMAIDSED